MLSGGSHSIALWTPHLSQYYTCSRLSLGTEVCCSFSLPALVSIAFLGTLETWHVSAWSVRCLYGNEWWQQCLSPSAPHFVRVLFTIFSVNTPLSFMFLLMASVVTVNLTRWLFSVSLGLIFKLCRILCTVWYSLTLEETSFLPWEYLLGYHLPHREVPSPNLHPSARSGIPLKTRTLAIWGASLWSFLYTLDGCSCCFWHCFECP